MALNKRRTVIVGMSVAGIRAAEELRRQNWNGDLTLIGAESHFPPVDRPPLSKELLSGEFTLDEARLKVRPLDASIMLGRVAVRLNVKERFVQLDDESMVPFDNLIIASGTSPRTLSVGASLGGLHLLRTPEDCSAIRRALNESKRVVIVGAGFVGCEVAATCQALGLQVTLIEPLPTPLHRAFGQTAGSLVGAMHTEHGVDLRAGVAVTGVVEGRDSNGARCVRGVVLSDGSEVACEGIIVAIGVVPSTDWLEGSGLLIDNGVVCDETCAAVGVEGIVAAGDVARWMHPIFKRRVRVEHWTNAMEQGRHAARRLIVPTGEVAKPYSAIPFFWSNQYDHMIQFVGISSRDESSVEEIEGGTRVVRYRENGRLVGALVVDGPQLIAGFRKQIIAENRDLDAVGAPTGEDLRGVGFPAMPTTPVSVIPTL